MTIQGAIDSFFDSGISGFVCVASGAYNESVTMKKDISIYGGYSNDFSINNPAANETIIKAANTTAIFCDSAITAGVTISGFTINGGNSSYASTYGINNNGGVPVISYNNNNKINGGAGSNSSCGIFNSNASQTVIKGNYINGGGDLSAAFTVDKDNIARTVPWSIGAYEKD